MFVRLTLNMDHNIDMENLTQLQQCHDSSSTCSESILAAVHQQFTEINGVNLNGEAVRSQSGGKEEKVCRICHLSGNGDGDENSCSSNGSDELIELGCGCKDELGISHYQCAHTWFSLKRTRRCEICGETAKNIDGIDETNIRMQRTAEVQPNVVTIQNVVVAPVVEGDRTSNFCIQSSCNFLLFCLVFAFFLPWIFPTHKS